MHIVMIAAENGALPGGKVGGLGDVIRDVPPALAADQHHVTVLTPGYGILAPPTHSEKVVDLQVNYSGRQETLALFRIQSTPASTAVRAGSVTQLVLEHWLFSAGGVGNIYCSDHYGPFATDAHKFALFCIAACELIKQNIIPSVDVIHCHDWHTSLVLLLRQFDKRYQDLQNITTVFSIHNLSIQGVRPVRGDDSSLESWLPELHYDPTQICDPSENSCINFMRTGINLADKVHTVSPTYAAEILLPSNASTGFVGGEGLEVDLQTAQQQNRLFGILNGCDYSQGTLLQSTPSATNSVTLWSLIDCCLDQWAKANIHGSRSYYFALRRLTEWRRKRKTPTPTLISIGRLTDQKIGLLMQDLQVTGQLEKLIDTPTVLDALLTTINPGRLIVLGSGEPHYDQFLTEAMEKHPNLLFLSGYSEPLANALYQYGDLFLMPSTFEPCGISQMLAMRAGTPCLVHGVGGLRDTVIDGKNGFSFSGDTTSEQTQHLLETVDKALNCFKHDQAAWKNLCEGALASRFYWQYSIHLYCRDLYGATTKTKKIGLNNNVL